MTGVQTCALPISENNQWIEALPTPQSATDRSTQNNRPIPPPRRRRKNLQTRDNTTTIADSRQRVEQNENQVPNNHNLGSTNRNGAESDVETRNEALRLLSQHASQIQLTAAAAFVNVQQLMRTSQGEFYRHHMVSVPFNGVHPCFHPLVSQ